jgi:hypothetical protein
MSRAIPEGLIGGEEVQVIHRLSFASKWRSWSSSRHWLTAEIDREYGCAIQPSRSGSGQSAPCSGGEPTFERKLVRLAPAEPVYCQFQPGTTCETRVCRHFVNSAREALAGTVRKGAWWRQSGKRLIPWHWSSTSCRLATDLCVANNSSSLLREYVVAPVLSLDEVLMRADKAGPASKADVIGELT